MRQCGDDLAAIVLRIGETEHYIATVLSDEELQQGTSVNEVKDLKPLSVT
jgi:hypothetical protein